MSRKDLLRAGPPCPRECANWEPLLDAAEAALGCGYVGCVKVRRVGGPGSGARGLFRVEMTWAAPGGGGARGLPRAGTARAVPGGGGVGCTGSRPGKARAGPPLFIPGRAFSKNVRPVLRAEFWGTGALVFKKGFHRSRRFLSRSPRLPKEPPRSSPHQSESAIQKPAALFCGGASRTGLCRRARPRQTASFFGTRPIKKQGRE